VDITFRIPRKQIDRVAAYTADGTLMNAVFDGQMRGEWQVFTITLDATLPV